MNIHNFSICTGTTASARTQVSDKDPEAGEEAADEEDVLRTIEEMGSIPLLQPVRVGVHSIERVPVTEPTSLSSFFRIPGYRYRTEQRTSDTEYVVVLSEIAAYPGTQCFP